MSQCSIEAVIFDMDGVITATASVHSRAWKQSFDEYLRLREKRDGEEFREFTHEGDYLPHVDGKPRYKGVADFLASRGIQIPFGDPSDEPSKETACGIGNRKNQLFNEIIDHGGAEVFESTVGFIKDLKKKGVRIGVASSSKNCETILVSTNLIDLFETRVDGVVSAELGLHGKPEADIFTVACDNLGCSYANSVVVEDAVSGVQAGRNGNFGLVLGIAREDNADELLANGADFVVTDISETSVEEVEELMAKGKRNE
ncbi:MAG: HAD-IA family hydrolase [Verrucomicrobia bacterium]|nr:HAD-IA family hydrolase [Verrucomicrobiota bacterium]